MKLRKKGDIVRMPIPEIIRTHGPKVLETEAKAARELAPRLESDVPLEERLAKIEEAIAQAHESLEEKAKGFDGIVLTAKHLGWSQAEAWRLTSEANAQANARELLDLRKKHTAEEWPDLHQGRVAAPGAQAREDAYVRTMYAEAGVGLEGVEGLDEDTDLVDVVKGFGLDNVFVPAILRAQRPTDEQVF